MKQVIELVGVIGIAWVIVDLISQVTGQQKPVRRVNPAYLEYKALQAEQKSWIESHKKWWQSPTNKYLLRDYREWVNTDHHQEWTIDF
jgi:hypothetical protein